MFACAALFDELECDWAAAILCEMPTVSQCADGLTMNCRVVYAAES